MVDGGWWMVDGGWWSCQTLRRGCGVMTRNLALFWADFVKILISNGFLEYGKSPPEEEREKTPASVW
jgi:hypothetical protein